MVGKWKEIATRSVVSILVRLACPSLLHSHCSTGSQLAALFFSHIIMSKRHSDGAESDSKMPKHVASGDSHVQSGQEATPDCDLDKVQSGIYSAMCGTLGARSSSDSVSIAALLKVIGPLTLFACERFFLRINEKVSGKQRGDLSDIIAQRIHSESYLDQNMLSGINKTNILRATDYISIDVLRKLAACSLDEEILEGCLELLRGCRPLFLKADAEEVLVSALGNVSVLSLLRRWRDNSERNRNLDSSSSASSSASSLGDINRSKHSRHSSRNKIVRSVLEKMHLYRGSLFSSRMAK